MKTTGIVRRLDELGRIVIPKEYRKLYGIEIGDPLEIKGNENGTITVSKVSNRAELLALCKSVCDCISAETGVTVAATDFFSYVYASGVNKDKAMTLAPDPAVVAKVKERRCGCLPAQTEWYSYLTYAPIAGVSDVFGGLVAFSSRAADDIIKFTVRLGGRLVGNALQKF